MNREVFENGILDQCQKLGIRPLDGHQWEVECFSKKSNDERILEIQRKISTLCKKYKADADQVLLAWIRKHPAGITPVLGTSKLSRIKKACDSLEIKLTHEDWYLLWQASSGEDVA